MYALFYNYPNNNTFLYHYLVGWEKKRIFVEIFNNSIMLTGQAEIDFFQDKDKELFEKKSKKYQYSSYIRFFIENGIQLTYRKNKLGGNALFFSNEYDMCGWNYIDYQEKVIQKACSVYNNEYGVITGDGDNKPFDKGDIAQVFSFPSLDMKKGGVFKKQNPQKST